ncbi:MAG: cobalamin biosynthesis protein CbiM [Coriobacteriia bacterium]|nr:cobalamin biosynthesis protein CbiM [Coriobacteriia bacterium]
MHMADALLSPAVGGAMWVASAATAVYCAKKVREKGDSSKIPLMGVVAAFIFAAQMINFTIPGTGSSGHLGGGLILAVLLGPEAGFLAIASVLTVQCLFFADGGLLALGCNIFNLGVFPMFIAYPIFKRILGGKWSTGRVVAASIVGAEIGLLLGAFAVVLETTASGISSLPFGTFVLMMLPVHAAIALVEGLVTAAVILFVRQAQPEMLERSVADRSLVGMSLKPVILGLVAMALVTGIGLSWFASSNPDGLEWSIAKVTGSAELAEETSVAITEFAAEVQSKTAFLPDYGFKASDDAATETEGGATWPAVDAGTSTAGIVGGALTLGLAGLIGFALSKRRRGSPPADSGTGA